jgi:hypothetical protein
MEVIVKDYVGSTSAFYKVEDGYVVKSILPAIADRNSYKVVVEKEILEILRAHPRIIKFVTSSLPPILGSSTKVALS